MAAVSIKVPVFDETTASSWFAIIEAQFHIASITTSSTKFYHVIANLPPNVVSRIPSTVLTAADYDDLKRHVIQQVEATKPELFDELIREKTLIGKPSIFLSDLRQLASKVGVGDDLVRHRFQQSLPPNMAPIIASQKALDLDALGRLADELMPICTSSQNSVNIVKHRAQGSSHHHSFQNQNANRNRFFNDRSKTIARDVEPFSENQRPKICRAHIYFAGNAKTCREWCKWPNKGDAKIMPNSRKSTPFPSRSPSPTRDLNF